MSICRYIGETEHLGVIYLAWDYLALGQGFRIRVKILSGSGL